MPTQPSAGRFAGKVALVTGAARGQGRAHAERLAAEGADLILCDICAQVETTKYPPASPEDLDETVRLVEQAGRRAVARTLDVRDLESLTALARDGADTLGGLDVVVANAGILSAGRLWEISPEQWQAVIGVNLTGVWNTIKATVPLLIDQGRGGVVILVSSVAGLKGVPFAGHYAAAKHGVVGLCRTLANELGEYDIRVNSVHPAGVDTVMNHDPDLFPLILQHQHTLGAIFQNNLDHGFMKPEEMADVVAWLASDEARHMTGAHIPVDFGNLAR